MKEIMLPYILVCWLLVKTGIVKWNLRSGTLMVSIGMFIATMLFISHRFWSPADLTDSTTVKAPHAVLSPLIGQEVDQVFVTVKPNQNFYNLDISTQDCMVVEFHHTG